MIPMTNTNPLSKLEISYFLSGIHVTLKIWFTLANRTKMSLVMIRSANQKPTLADLLSES